MTHRITKAISVMNSAHQIKTSVRDVFYSPKHFPKILAASMLSATVGGYCMMDSIHKGRAEAQEKMYAEAWNLYKHEKERHNEQYETALKPTSLQKRRLTKSDAVVVLSPTLLHQNDDSTERARLVQE